ncbi:ROK family protein [Lederbergia sp. NSJ-179]|uniref:ROK family protein n=1 Tax=Lederbergia sp. NSJ-179 TaxID=2931402 RepID=UPI001FD1FC1B|nr:ROK family protein [Lederbergia sp. NSJ-179]MCJ7843220.1 ROK family protein [Lederbergia sp. NSJ-179]
MKRFVVLDVGGTFVKAAVMDEAGGILQEEKVPTPPSGDGAIFRVIREIFHKQKLLYPDIAGLALSIPGAVDVDSGYVSYAGAVMDVIGVKMKDELSDLGVPVEVENDANCAALAEKWKGNAQDCDNFLCVTIGTGIGGAIFSHEEIVHGVEGMAGEFGLMMLDTHADIPELLENRNFSRYSSTWNIVHCLNQHFGDEKTGEEWFKLYDENNEEVKTIVHTFYDRLSIGIINLMHIFAPEKIVIGGGISGRPELIPYIKKQIAKVPTAIATKMDIQECKQKNKAGLIGALYHFQKMNGVL